MDTLVRGRRIRYVLYIDLGSSLGVPGERVEKVSEVSGALARGFPETKDMIIGTMKNKVLFVCIHNSARSQMAEAFLNQVCGEEFDDSLGGVPNTPAAHDTRTDRVASSGRRGHESAGGDPIR